MKFIFFISFISFCFSQNTAAISTTEHDFYRLNMNSARAMGQGYSGIADHTQFTNMFNNPAIFLNSDEFHFQFNIANKTDTDFRVGSEFEAHGPTLRFDGFLPLTPSLNLGLSFDQSRTYRWDNYSAFDFIDDSTVVLITDNFIEQTVSEFNLAMAYKLDETHHVGISLIGVYGKHREKFGRPDPYTNTDFELSYILGYHLAIDDDLAMGLSFRSRNTMNYEDSTKQGASINFFNSFNEIPSQLSLGIHYKIDEDTEFNLDVIQKNYRERKGFYKPQMYEFRTGFKLKYEEFDFTLGAFSIADPRNKDEDNFQESDGFYTQLFLTTGITYFLDSFDLSFSYASSDLVSNKQASHSKYGMGIEFKL